MSNEDVQSAEETDANSESHDVSETDQTCDVAKYKKCGTAYAKALGLDPMPKDPEKFVAHLREIYVKEGAKGFMRVCR